MAFQLVFFFFKDAADVYKENKKYSPNLEESDAVNLMLRKYRLCRHETSVE